MKTCFSLAVTFFYSHEANAQFPVTIPWSSSVNFTFSDGKPLPAGYSDFTYSSSSPPAGGSYSIMKSSNDAGHFYFGPFPMSQPVTGYKMVGGYGSWFVPKMVFRDTVHNLCGNSKYLFWAGINNPAPGSCFYPNFLLSVETTSGTIIKTFQTGDIGGPSDNYSWYYGYYDRTKASSVPFYGGIFQLPAGVKDIVVKIITNNSKASPCGTDFEIDNIILMPVGPDIRISSSKYPGGWIAASCAYGDVPLDLNGKIESGYRDFGTPNYISDNYTNPGFQWQQSLDDGYTWTDIPGATNINMSHNFSIPDTFWVRLRVSEIAVIGNPNCSNVSNVVQVQVDQKPKDFSLTTNSPVCTDGDLKLNVSGGASYRTYGPDGFFDSSPFPHIYHPALADSGWYYAEIFTFGGCKAVDSEFVRVIGPNLSVSSGKVVCYGDTVHLHASGGVSYSWSPPEGLSNAGIANPIASPSKTTKYNVKVSDDNGCSAYGDVTITLRNSILKAIIEGADIACPGDVVLFKDTSIGKITSWYWNFGNGNTSTLKNPPAQRYPPSNSFFPVNLTITDTSGCEQNTKKMIHSVNNCFIAVPNAFTPNGDGLNDFLYPLNAYKATNLEFKVFDRWGRMVFKTSEWTKKWDGTVAGVPQPTGVYVWMLRYTDADQKQVFLKGISTLIR